MRFFTVPFNGSRTFDAAGAPIPTTAIIPSLHYIATDEPDALKALDKFIKAGVGGFTEVSKSELEDVKKKATSLKTSPPDSIGGVRSAMDTTTRSHHAAKDAAEVGDSMLPISEEIRAIKAKHQIEDEKEKHAPPPPTPPVVSHRHGKATPHDPS